MWCVCMHSMSVVYTWLHTTMFPSGIGFWDSSDNLTLALTCSCLDGHRDLAQQTWPSPLCVRGDMTRLRSASPRSIIIVSIIIVIIAAVVVERPAPLVGLLYTQFRSSGSIHSQRSIGYRRRSCSLDRSPCLSRLRSRSWSRRDPF